MSPSAAYFFAPSSRQCVQSPTRSPRKSPASPRLQQRIVEVSAQKLPSKTIPPKVGATTMDLLVFPDFGVGESPLWEIAK